MTQSARGLLLVGLFVAIAAGLYVLGWALLGGVVVSSSDASSHRAGGDAGSTGRSAGGSDGKAGALPPPATWRIEGIVKEHDGRPIAGAEIRMWFERGDLLDAVPSVTTGADGRYATTTSVPAAWGEGERGAARLHAIAQAPRHHPSVAGTAEVLAPDETMRIDLYEQVGAAVTGRVVTEDGRPVAGVGLTLCSEGEAPGIADTDAMGRYSIPILSRGVRTLAAWRADLGVGGSSPFPVDPSTDLAAPDLVVKPFGVIEGRAVDPEGKPARYARIRADAAQPPAPTRTTCRTRGEPRLHANVEADAQGRFRIPGLSRDVPGGLYLVQAQADELRSQALYAPGARDVVVTCPEHRFVLFVRDESGRPVPGAEFEMRGDTSDATFSGAGAVTGADAHVAVPVPKGASMTVRVATKHRRTGTLTYALDDEKYENEAVVVLADPPGAGSIHLVVRDAEGKPVPAFRVEMAPVAQRPAVRVSYAFGADEDGRSPKVEPGEYALDVWPGRSPGLLRREFFLPEHRTVAVPSGSESLVEIAAKAAGRLRLTLRLPAGVAGIHEPRIELRLLPSGETVRIHSADLTETGLAPLRDDAPADRPVEYFEPLAPGRYALTVDAPRYHRVARVVEIEGGRTTDVEVRLETE